MSTIGGKASSRTMGVASGQHDRASRRLRRFLTNDPRLTGRALSGVALGTFLRWTAEEESVPSALWFKARCAASDAEERAQAQVRFACLAAHVSRREVRKAEEVT